MFQNSFHFLCSPSPGELHLAFVCSVCMVAVEIALAIAGNIAGNASIFRPQFLCSPECTGLLPRGFGSWQTKCAPLGLKFEPHCLTGIFDVLWMPHTPNSPVFHCHGNPQPYRFDIWVELACSSGSTHNLGFESARLEVYWLIAGPAPTLTPGCN